MKSHTILLLILLGALTAPLSAQNNDDPYTRIMTETIRKLDTISSGGDLRPLLATFERISRVEEERWLPHYYMAICNATMAVEAENLDEVDRLCDKAIASLAHATAAGGEQSEILIVRAVIRYASLRVNYMARGKDASEKALRDLTQAAKLNPENPRVYAMLARHYLNVPIQLGGDRDRACQYARLAFPAYEEEKIKNGDTYSLAPHWGEEDLQKLADRFCATLNKKKKK